jgi:hypothetical protein
LWSFRSFRFFRFFDFFRFDNFHITTNWISRPAFDRGKESDLLDSIRISLSSNHMH